MNNIYNGYASGSLDDGNCISDNYNNIKVYRFYLLFIINFVYTPFSRHVAIIGKNFW